MNNSDLRELMGRLEALEALAKLFNNLWFDRIREDIKDAKVQAYLTVFDDAFPHVNHVIEFVRRSAGLLSDGYARERRQLIGAEAGVHMGDTFRRDEQAGEIGPGDPRQWMNECTTHFDTIDADGNAVGLEVIDFRGETS